MTVADGVKVTVDEAFAFVAGEVLVRGDEAHARLRELGDPRQVRRWKVEVAGAWTRVMGVERPLPLIRALQAEGHVAQPNHVMSAHGCGDDCGPHPAAANAMLAWLGNPYAGNPYAGNPYAGNPYAGNPYAGNPYAGNPYAGNPLAGNPLAGNPYAGNPYAGNKPPESSAVPAPGPSLAPRELKGAGKPPVIAVLDTGLAAPRPDLLDGLKHVTGEVDLPDVDLYDVTGQLRPADQHLDPAAGHGTFITGLIEQLAPGCRIHVAKVLSPFGLATEFDVAASIDALVAGTHEGLKTVPDVIAISFGGGAMGTPNLMAASVQAALAKGIVVVASAGNAATCAPQYPAALDGVLAVAALGPDGPAPWSNYGDWVDVCAPGTNLVSAFFASFDGAYTMKNTVDVDRFAHWARWSGTSFAVPVVIAALAREMVAGKCDVAEAVARVVHAPHLMRVPCMGTVVNI